MNYDFVNTQLVIKDGKVSVKDGNNVKLNDSRLESSQNDENSDNESVGNTFSSSQSDENNNNIPKK